MLTWHEGYLRANNWTSPASKSSRGENYNLQMMPLLQSNTSCWRHLEPTTGICFYYQNHNSPITKYKSMSIFFYKMMPAKFCLLENASSKFLLHLKFILCVDFYLIYCTSQVGEEVLSFLANREELNEKKNQTYCSSVTTCLHLPAKLRYPMEIHWYPSDHYKHFCRSKSHIWVIPQEPRQYFIF